MNKINLIALAIVCSTFSAKPMYQPIFEQTCNFLAEVAPEIAATGGALALALSNPRTGYPMPEPEQELVGNDSQGKDITLDELTRDAISDVLHESIRLVSNEMDRRSNSGCNIF